jgi:hypothetical protein
MKKMISKKTAAILASAVLATALIAIPVLATTSNVEGDSFFSQMQSFMTSEKHLEIMNTSAMQNLHNSEAMKEAMKNGDVAKMQEAMNLNSEVKAILGEETLNQMNTFMQENGQTMNQMMQGQNLEAMNQKMQGQNLGAMNQMMNGENKSGMNQMMGKFQGQGMMGSASTR